LRALESGSSLADLDKRAPDLDSHSAQINRYWRFIPHRRFRFSSNRLRDLGIASNAAGDIFQHEMHKRRRLSHELATD
jgi:hypothetical protein